jgi:hypothetical protein
LCLHSGQQKITWNGQKRMCLFHFPSVTCDFIRAYQPCASEITACNKREIAFPGWCMWDVMTTMLIWLDKHLARYVEIYGPRREWSYIRIAVNEKLSKKSYQWKSPSTEIIFQHN